MITKERLEELIEQGDTIYEAKYNDIVPVSLTNEIKCISWKYGVISFKPMRKDKWLHHKYFKNLFETEEEAREHLEFGKVIRTEKLELPSWEDIKDTGYDEIFFVKDNRFDSGIVQYYFLVAEQTKQIQIMFREIQHIMTIDAYDVIFQKPLTKENYNEARRLCIKLFKGEK